MNRLKSAILLLVGLSIFMSPIVAYSGGHSQLSVNEIRLIQKALNIFEFDVGKPDGIAGNKTLNGLKEFFLERSLPFDGKLSKNEFDFFKVFFWTYQSLSYPEGAPLIISDFQSLYGVNGGKRRKRHQGIDMTGPVGQPILAAADGKVLEATEDICWGPTIAIDHGWAFDGSRLIALYGHLGDMLVSEGDKVKRGSTIALLGNNQKKFKCIGGVRHLHFQIGELYRPKYAKGNGWGHLFFLVDGNNGLNPHMFWADGPNKITCFKTGAAFREGTLTYPLPCQ